MKSICVIPARFASTRLPGKPLAKINDKPMVQWVYERASAAQSIDKVLVATDHEDVRKAVMVFGGNVVMTDPALASGTDRVYQAIKDDNFDVVINLQGDEPFIFPGLLDEMVKLFENPNIQIATPISPVKSVQELTDPNLVRVIKNTEGVALYFSRAVIPFIRDEKDPSHWLVKHHFYKHIGIYAYRKNVLAELTKLPESALEKAEKLEQLRFLENGYKIHTYETDYESISVDTIEDLDEVNLIAKNK